MFIKKKDFSKKICVLMTGASKGIGEHMALELSRSQKISKLILIARDIKALEQVKKSCLSIQPSLEIVLVSCDLADRQSLSELDVFLPEVDVLIHNAGYGLFQFAENFTEEEVRDMFEVNLFAPIELTRKTLPFLYQKKQGHIIFIASQASKMVTPKSSVYSSTKFAVRGYAEGLRLEAKSKGVWVSVVNPGPVKTNFFNRADKTGNYFEAVKHWALEPDWLAKKIVRLIFKPKRELNLPWSMHILSKLSVLFPHISDRLTINFGNKK